ncbi:unnamed protein product, partial [Toxocara canis]|uniref:Nuclear receptor n=1 Tax=Toxocara canis TaxID=6265 RepID=A0A183UQJ8_TOXCA
CSSDDASPTVCSPSTTDETSGGNGGSSCSGQPDESRATHSHLSRQLRITNSGCPRFCAICGGSATGYHYDVASCNGCKAFFRRSFMSGKRYECKGDRKCKLNKGSRIWCRACRFEKCVEVGMKPELMYLSKKSASSGSPGSLANHECLKSLPMPTLTTRLLRLDKTEYGAIIGSLQYVEMKCEFLRRSSFDPNDNPVSLVDIINAPSHLAIVQPYQTVTEWSKKQPRQLEYHGEVRKLEIVTSKLWVMCDLVLTVEFAKTLPFFDKLSCTDKYLLMKNTALVNCSLLQSYYSYKSGSNTIVYPDGIVPILYTKRPLAVEVILRCRGVDSLIRAMIDRCEYVLLKAIIFTHCPAEGLSVEGTKLLENERQNYAKVLFNYVNVKYGTNLGPSKFVSLLTLVHTFFALADKHRQFHVLMSTFAQLAFPPWDIFDEVGLPACRRRPSVRQ